MILKCIWVNISSCVVHNPNLPSLYVINYLWFLRNSLYISRYVLAFLKKILEGFLCNVIFQSLMSSLWLISLCIGSFVGAGLGSVTFDQFGFSWSCSIEAVIIGVSVSVLLWIKGRIRSCWFLRSFTNKNT